MKPCYTYTYGNSKWLDLLTGFNDEPILYEGQTLVNGVITGDPISGNPISYFNGTRWSFDWQNGRQLVSASSTDATGLVDTEISYEYDINGLRTSKTVITSTYEDAPTHNYVPTVVAPTCTEDGYTLYSCACGDSYRGQMSLALGHNWVSDSTDPTGRLQRCTRCGETRNSGITPPINPPQPPVEYWSLDDEEASSTCGGTERILVSTVTEHHEYVYASGKLLREVITTTNAEGDVTKEVLDFTYDASGSPYTLTYTNGTASPVTYYYVVNLQGDVMRLVSASGATVVEYWYGPYGEVLTASGAMGEVNPLRYRGYYYDAESGFYYLQSRYYDPMVCRFVNADAYASTGQGFLGQNMFAYCNNSSIGYADSTGHAAKGSYTVVMADYTYRYIGDDPIIRKHIGGLTDLAAQRGCPSPDKLYRDLGSEFYFPKGENVVGTVDMYVSYCGYTDFGTNDERAAVGKAVGGAALTAVACIPGVNVALATMASVAAGISYGMAVYDVVSSVDDLLSGLPQTGSFPYYSVEFVWTEVAMSSYHGGPVYEYTTYSYTTMYVWNCEFSNNCYWAEWKDVGGIINIERVYG